MKTSKMLKITAIQARFESIKLYMILVQPSRVIIWNTVTIALKILSNVVTP